MKFVKYIVPYLLISPVSVAVFFIALFVSCISIEFVMHAVLTVLGVLSLISKTAQNPILLHTVFHIFAVCVILILDAYVREVLLYENGVFTAKVMIR